MPRAARKKSSSGYYHVILRGINKQTVFYDDEDRKVFLDKLKIVKQKDDYDMIAFCLMNNHVHLLIKEKIAPVGIFIRKILSSYVYWYNSKYERVGNLFQDRFKSEPIECDEYLLCCVRYILQNPLKVKMCEKIWDYRWSNARLLTEDKDAFIETSIIKNMFNSKEDLIKFMEETEELKFLEWESKVQLTDQKLKEKIIKTLKNQNIFDIMRMDEKERNEVLKKIMGIDGATMLQVSRITGVPYHFIRYLE